MEKYLYGGIAGLALAYLAQVATNHQQITPAQPAAPAGSRAANEEREQ